LDKPEESCHHILTMFAWIKSLFAKEPKVSGVVVLAIGHSRKIRGRLDGGAVSVVGKVSEWSYNSDLSLLMADYLRNQGLEVIIISDYKGAGYSKAMEWLSGNVRSIGADCAVELHFNSATPSANGHEWIYEAGDDEGKRLAESIKESYSAAVASNIKFRRYIAATKKDNGFGFVSKMPCPAVVLEPFFGSRSYDWRYASSNKKTIAEGMAKGIATFLKNK